MTDESTIKPVETPETGPVDDTEGHNLWIDPGSARDLTRNRELERQRELEKRQRAKEAKGR